MDAGQGSIRCAILPRMHSLILSTTSNVPPDPSLFNTILLSSQTQEWTLRYLHPPESSIRRLLFGCLNMGS